MKKIIFILFAVVSWQHTLSQNFTYDGLNYTVTGATTVAVASSAAATGTISIPSNLTYDSSTYSVTSIGDNAFQGCNGLTSVSIPNSVTSIGTQAFAFCNDLTSVSIPNSVTSIGNDAFSYCRNLTTLLCDIATPLSINPNVFDQVNQGACGLTVPAASITAYQNAAVWQNFNPISDTMNFKSSGINYKVTSPTTAAVGTNTGIGGSIVIPVSVTDSFGTNYTVISIGDNAFQGCNGLTSVSIPNSVISIGTNAFKNCISLVSVSIPNSVTSIGDSAFHSCFGLTSITIPNSVTSIGNSAFYMCTSITSVIIPDSVTSIGNAAFSYCYSLASVSIPESVTSIGSSTFLSCYSLTSVTIPNTVISIGNKAFNYCHGLISVTIPNSVTSIGDEAFSNTGLNIPNSVTSIGDGAFYITGLKSITIPNSVTSIGNEAFMICSGLTSVSIPNSVTSIGNDAFSYCRNLTTLRCDIASPLSINSNVFDQVNQGACSLTVPAPSLEVYQSAAVWQNFNPIVCETTFNTTTVAGCDSYTWNGTVYTTSGLKTGTTTNCVTEQLNLTITPSSNHTTAVSACGSYTWANTGQTYTVSGTYTRLTTYCVTEFLQLTVNTPPSIPNQSAQIPDQVTPEGNAFSGFTTQYQTFTAGFSGELQKISVYLGNPFGNISASTLTVTVYEGLGTSGAPLGSATYTYPAKWGFQYTDFNFSGISVVQGQQYTFEVKTPPSRIYAFLQVLNNNEYTGGSVSFNPGYDLVFKTYVVFSNQTFCAGATVANLMANGTNLKWYSAATGGIQLASNEPLVTGRYYVSQSNDLCESERASVAVLIRPTTAITSQPATNFICSTVGSTSTFSVVSNAISPSYTWQYRVVTTANANPTWITITSANAAVYSGYDTATLNVTKTATLPATGTQYRVLVSGSCGVATSNFASLMIISTVRAGTITSAASVCVGGDITLTLGAYVGTSFQWQSAATATGLFANIAGATGTTYTIAGATATMHKAYRVLVTNSCTTTATTATTAIKTLIVSPTSVSGTVTGGGIVCSGSTGTLKVAGYVGVIQWQYSVDGIEFKTVPYRKTVATVPTFYNPDNATSFSTATSTGIASTYIATNITAATYFRAKINSGACSVTYSNAVQFTMGTASSAGTLTAAAATVCSSKGTTLTLSGAVGTIKWLKSTNWTAAIPTWTAVTTSTIGNLATGNLTVSTAYKAEVTIGSCSTVTTEVVPVLVYAAPLAKTITANVSSPTGATQLLAICTTAATSKVLTIGSGYNGTIQWQKSTTSTTTGFTDIAEATATSYTITNPAVGANYYRAKFTNSCGVVVYSSAFTVYYKDCTVAKTRVKPVVENAKFKVIAYPNPYTENFNLNLTTSSVDKITVSVYDMVGKLLDQREVSPKAVSGIQVGDNYPSGVYNVILAQGENKKTVRVVKR